MDSLTTNRLLGVAVLNPPPVVTLWRRKGVEWYILTFPRTEAGRAGAIRAVGAWASEPELWFTAFDGAKMCKAIREAMQ